MIKARNVRQLVKESGPNYRSKLRELLGVETKENPEGTFPSSYNAEKAQIGAEEFSIRDLTEEFLGQGFVSGLHNGKTKDSYSAQLREALNPVSASNFTDINAFNQTIGGLIEVRILKGYQLPEFISDQLFETMPTRVNGGKMIGIPNVSLPDGPTVEGQEYPSIGLTERWVIAQPNVKYALKLALTREAVVYDLSGELLTSAESMGQSLGYVKEYWCAGVAQGENIAAGTPGFMTGRTTNTFIYKGQPTDNPNNTYQTSAGTGTTAKYNYVNSLSNQLVDYVSVQNVQAKLNLMREYETGYPIMAPLEDAIVSPNVEYAARAVIHATQILGTQGSSGLAGASGVGTFAANPIPSRLKIYSSPIWNKQLVDGGVSQSNADIYWYAGSFKRAFVWREVWPLSVVQANPLTTEMLQSDIVNAWYCSWYGVPVVRDPHYVVQNTN